MHLHSRYKVSSDDIKVTSASDKLIACSPSRRGSALGQHSPADF